MGSLFGSPKSPPLIKPKRLEPLPPPVTKADQADELKKAQEEEKRRRPRGRATTLLTGGQGVVGDDTSGLATKTLLGG